MSRCELPRSLCIPRVFEEIRSTDLGRSGRLYGIADRYRPNARVVVRIPNWTRIHFEALSAASRSNLLPNQCAKRVLIVRHDDKPRKVSTRGCPPSYRRASELHLDESGKDWLGRHSPYYANATALQSPYGGSHPRSLSSRLMDPTCARPLPGLNCRCVWLLLPMNFIEEHLQVTQVGAVEDIECWANERYCAQQ